MTRDKAQMNNNDNCSSCIYTRQSGLLCIDILNEVQFLNPADYDRLN